MKFDWKTIAGLVAQLVLSSNPKTAPIANEVTAGIQVAEGLFTKGSDKKTLVLGLARIAAQASDELRGGADETVGAVGEAVDKVVGAANAIQDLISAGKGSTAVSAVQ